MLPVSYRVLTLAAVLMTLPVLLSCNARKTMAEQTITHDTLHAFHTDTIRLSTHHSRADTVRESMVQVITLRQDSAHTDTVRVETLRERWQTVYVTDTTDAYRHLADSLQAMKDRQMVKRQTVWRYYPVKWCFIALLLMAVALAALKYLPRSSRHSSDV